MQITMAGMRLVLLTSQINEDATSIKGWYEKKTKSLTYELEPVSSSTVCCSWDRERIRSHLWKVTPA